MSLATDALDVLEALLLDASASAELAISVDGVSFSFESREALMDYRQRLLREVAEETRLEEQPPIIRSVPVRMRGI